MSRRHRTWLIAISFAISQACLIQAHASNSGTASNSPAQSITAGNWSMVPVTDPATSTNPLTSLTINLIQRSTATPAWNYFWIKNFGSAELISLKVQLSTSSSSTYTANLSYCTAVPNLTPGTCANGGSWTAVTSTTDKAPNSVLTSITLNPLLLPSQNLVKNEALQFRVQYVKSGSNGANVNATVSATVTRADVRSASSFIG